MAAELKWFMTVSAKKKHRIKRIENNLLFVSLLSLGFWCLDIHQRGIIKRFSASLNGQQHGEMNGIYLASANNKYLKGMFLNENF